MPFSVLVSALAKAAEVEAERNMELSRPGGLGGVSCDGAATEATIDASGEGSMTGVTGGVVAARLVVVVVARSGS
jgi:hypothetical protein